MRVATGMPHARPVRTTTRAIENVIDHQQPSKLRNPVDEGSQPRTMTGIQSCIIMWIGTNDER